MSDDLAEATHENATTWRDTGCGDMRPSDAGRRVTLAGWVARRREHSSCVFVDLRDSTGVCQLVVEDVHPDVERIVRELRNEFVIQIVGTVVERDPATVNATLPTGEIEVRVLEVRILNHAPALPFQLNDEMVDEHVRIRYRWLDLRSDRMQRNLRARARVMSIMRQEMELGGFVDIETPIFAKPTPEGARDFVVPHRLRQGHFFALPQSPQIYKQLLVTGGFERYYQIARCFRDEDPRADRLQELTQLDIEMAFPDQEFLFGLAERIVHRVWRDVAGIELTTPFERMPYREAMDRFGSDKPDLRFELEIADATAVTRDSAFRAFADAPCVRYLTVPSVLSRRELTDLEALGRERGAKGLGWIARDEAGELKSPIAKFLSPEELQALAPPAGSTTLAVAGHWNDVVTSLGAVRLRVGQELDLVDKTKWRFLWVTDFPLLDWNQEEGRWHATHHPFTRPAAGSRELLEESPGDATAVAYDLVGNGMELAGGSFRIHEPELQQTMFDLLNIGREEQRAKFGFLLDALAMGAPPHGGIASGVDRLMMALLGEPAIRDTIAFPKSQTGTDPMTGAPSPLDREHLAELGLVVPQPNPMTDGT